MENEIRETTYIAVALIITAIVITFMSYALGLERHAAANRSQQAVVRQVAEKYRQFAAYDSKTIIGDEVIELIRLNYDSNVSIFVNYRKNIKTGAVVNSHETCNLCDENTGDHRIYNKDMYNLHSHTITGDTDRDYFFIDVSADSENENSMRYWFDTKSRYRAYLAYNNEDLAKYAEDIIHQYQMAGGGQGDSFNASLMDEYAEGHETNAELTGVVVLDIDHLW